MEKIKQDKYNVIGSTKVKTEASLSLFKSKDEDAKFIQLQSKSSDTNVLARLELTIAAYLLQAQVPDKKFNTPNFGDWLARESDQRVPLLLVECLKRDAADLELIKVIRGHNGYNYPCLWSLQSKGRLVFGFNE